MDARDDINAKGARKKSLELMAQLKDTDDEIERAALELRDAQLRLDTQKKKRSDIRFDLLDLIRRCMPSMGSDDGK